MRDRQKRRLPLKWNYYFVFFVYAVVMSCSFALNCSRTRMQTSTVHHGEGSEDFERELADHEVDPRNHREEQQAACVAYESDEVDPLKKWIDTFPIENGGIIVVFSGSAEQQIEAQVVLEMVSLRGYEDFACENSILIWVPGWECPDGSTYLIQQMHENTSMHHERTFCFRIDEIRLRVEEECSRGNLPSHRCP